MEMSDIFVSINMLKQFVFIFFIVHDLSVFGSHHTQFRCLKNDVLELLNA